ncbi:MAG: rRNA maturation RNase YbeY [Gammaproteobacteria bacterium]|nr:rRNA maturation RNase YbeY [Gammaproteobacteria bacterium]NIR98783.1 rRNA maturation RNase YbeY [Gammaproteobacteria bacterium]NIT64493.1 rRNA maturation RNase YbeY [Gammaproteobacteria bacterium]NIV21413.1 rRNA maturation RNase YbeY [Gammaproteobacteria bacterium]NIX11283.1 rRNA maturation RNase YbeY [Gammaproteobacteria bacterium]
MAHEHDTAGEAAAAPSVEVEVQYAVPAAGLPAAEELRAWVARVLAGRREAAEVVVRIVDEDESARLNETYRGKAGPTNVLSFPFAPPPGVPSVHIGDLVVCAPVIAREAHAQGKYERAHWAHVVVHGTLHLLGFDHAGRDQAEEMEREETRVLQALGIAAPYEE